MVSKKLSPMGSRMHRHLRSFILAGFLSISASACAPKGHVTEPTFQSGQYTFTDPKQAVASLKSALEHDDTTELSRIFGPQGGDLISSGDDVEDRASFKAFAERMNEKVEIEERVNQNPKLKNQRLAFLYVGETRYSFPIALHKRANGWRFDTGVGKEELINRRIGRNEIKAIQAMHRIVGAQRSFYQRPSSEGAPHQYAQRIFSSPGKRDGLYWDRANGQPMSPLGSAVASASATGYTPTQVKTHRTYYGYHFVILTKQGAEARGGVMNYVDAHGRMTKGFGLLAFPAKYGASGVMTFVSGPDGVIYQRNLGSNTETIARKMTAVNPGFSWIPVR